jgi:hypothetical protein
MREIDVECDYWNESDRDKLSDVLVRAFPEAYIFVNTDCVHVPDSLEGDRND